MKRVQQLCVVLLLAGAACRSDDPPTLDSYEIWDGPPGGASARQVMPGPDGTLTLSLDRMYTGRAYLRTSGRADRCIYRVFSYTWDPPSRQFNCWPETGEHMTIDEGIPTWRGDVSRVTDYRLTISVAEYDSEQRTELSRYTPHTYTVVFRP